MKDWEKDFYKKISNGYFDEELDEIDVQKLIDYIKQNFGCGGCGKLGSNLCNYCWED